MIAVLSGGLMEFRRRGVFRARVSERAVFRRVPVLSVVVPELRRGVHSVFDRDAKVIWPRFPRLGCPVSAPAFDIDCLSATRADVLGALTVMELRCGESLLLCDHPANPPIRAFWLDLGPAFALYSGIATAALSLAAASANNGH